jgi:hypothetical protein
VRADLAVGAGLGLERQGAEHMNDDRRFDRRVTLALGIVAILGTYCQRGWGDTMVGCFAVAVIVSALSRWPHRQWR